MGYGAFTRDWVLKCHFPHFIAISTDYFQREIETRQSDKGGVLMALLGALI